MNPTPNSERLERITDRQWDCIVLIARGYSYDRIGEELGTNPRNVKNWVHQLRLLLDVDRAEHVPYAFFKRTGHNPFEMKLRTIA